MLHPALIRALATAHIQDRDRAATPRQRIRLARGSGQAPRVSGGNSQQGGLKPRESQAGVRRK